MKVCRIFFRTLHSLVTTASSASIYELQNPVNQTTVKKQNGVKIIQTAGYNGARMVYIFFYFIKIKPPA